MKNLFSTWTARALVIVFAMFLLGAVSNFSELDATGYINSDDSLTVNNVRVLHSLVWSFDSLTLQAETDVAIFTPQRDITVLEFSIFGDDSLSGNSAGAVTDSLSVYWRSGTAVTIQRLWIPAGVTGTTAPNTATYTTDFNVDAATACTLWFNDADGDSASDWSSPGHVTMQYVDR